MTFEDPLWFSVYEEGRPRRRSPWPQRHVWRCPKCRHGFRRVLTLRPIHWEAYAVVGVVRPDLACERCRLRLEALRPKLPAPRQPIVGTRVAGVDA